MRNSILVVLLGLCNVLCLAQKDKLTPKDEKRFLEAKVTLLTDKVSAHALFEELRIDYPNNCELTSYSLLSKPSGNSPVKFSDLALQLENLESAPDFCLTTLADHYYISDNQIALDSLLFDKPQLAKKYPKQEQVNFTQARRLVEENTSMIVKGDLIHTTLTSKNNYIGTKMRNGVIRLTSYTSGSNQEQALFPNSTINFAFADFRKNNLVMAGCGDETCNLFISHQTNQNWTTPSKIRLNKAFEWVGSPVFVSNNDICFIGLEPKSTTFEDVYCGTLSGESLNITKMSCSTSDREIALSFLNNSLIVSSNTERDQFDLFEISNNELKPYGSDVNTLSDEVFIGKLNSKSVFISRRKENGYEMRSVLLSRPMDEAPMITIVDSSLDRSIVTVEAKDPITNESRWKRTFSNNVQFEAHEVEGVVLYFNKANHLFKSLTLDNSMIGSQVGVVLNPIQKDSKLIIDNIVFAKSSFKLEESSTPSINQLVEFLKEHPAISIEISGHTDDVGSASYNKRLSANRAKSVANMVISKGISSNRIKYAGYGSSEPMVPNNSDLNRAKNRRVEMKIL